MKSLLLVEDDNSLGDTLKDRLEKHGHKVFLARDLKSATEIIGSGIFLDLIILDVGLPDGTGFDFAKKLSKESNIPFLFVTARTTAEDRLTGFELGAVEFIPKPFHLKEFLIRVQNVLNLYPRRSSVVINGVTIDFNSMTIFTDIADKKSVPKKEMQLLEVLLVNSPSVVSRDDILDTVWGEEKYPSQRTVDNIIVRLRNYIHDKNGRCIKSVRGIGYQLIKEVLDE